MSGTINWNYCFYLIHFGNTDNIFLQLATQNCCIASWKALLHVLPPTSNIVTPQNFLVARWKNLLKKVDTSSTCCNMLLQLATTKFVAWQCLRLVVMRAKSLLNLQCNNVAFKIAAICCYYYFTSTTLRIISQSPPRNLILKCSDCHWGDVQSETAIT